MYAVFHSRLQRGDSSQDQAVETAAKNRRIHRVHRFLPITVGERTELHTTREAHVNRVDGSTTVLNLRAASHAGSVAIRREVIPSFRPWHTHHALHATVTSRHGLQLRFLQRRNVLARKPPRRQHAVERSRLAAVCCDATFRSHTSYDPRYAEVLQISSSIGPFCTRYCGRPVGSIRVVASGLMPRLRYKVAITSWK